MIERRALLALPTRRALVGGLVALLASACADRWRVVARADGYPFAGAKRLRVLPVDYTGLRVTGAPEAAWLAEQNEDERKRFARALDELSRAFAETLIAAARAYGITIEGARVHDPAAFEIVPRISAIEPGSFRTPWDALPSVVTLRATLLAPGGARDVIDLESSSPATQLRKGSDDRLRNDGRELGAACAAYLKARL